MVMTSERPAEADDRAVPGHWEGDLIVGSNSRSAIATLVERSTRFLMLVHLPQGHSAAAVRNVSAGTVQSLSPHLKRSLTWDQGAEMAAHGAFTFTTDVPVYFCEPGKCPGSADRTRTPIGAALAGRASSTGEVRRDRRVTRRTRAERLSVELSTAVHRARALAGSDLIEAC